MTTFKIYQDGKLTKTFENQDSDFPALKYIQNNQGQSFDWATTHGGWTLTYIDESGQELNYKTDKPHIIKNL